MQLYSILQFYFDKTFAVGHFHSIIALQIPKTWIGSEKKIIPTNQLCSNIDTVYLRDYT